jgi:hypothetical protein
MKKPIATKPDLFIAVANKSNAYIAAELSDKIKEAVYEYSNKIPLALAIGVLEIVKKEILDDA